MGSYQKRGSRWRVQVYRDGVRRSATFRTKGEAVQWADRQESELAGATLPDRSFRDACRRYAAEVSPDKRGEKWELIRLRMFERFPLASARMASLTATDLSEWRDARLREVSGASVAREMNLIRSVIEIARKEWRWIAVNPMKDVRRPKSPPSRKRRITDDEIARLSAGFGLGAGLCSATLTNRVGLAFLFAIETAMRSGEILAVRGGHVSGKALHIPHSKNGDARDVPLSTRAREILGVLPAVDGPLFGVDGASRDALFRKTRDRAQIVGLTFHDSRAEAIFRLSKRLDVLELARVIGHRDLRSLMLYYETSAAELADRLD